MDPYRLEPGGGDRIRTDDRLVANQVLYQLSYAPYRELSSALVSKASPASELVEMVGLTGFEPVTSRLSGERSNQLSYRPWLQSLMEEKGGSRSPSEHPTFATNRAPK